MTRSTGKLITVLLEIDEDWGLDDLQYEVVAAALGEEAPQLTDSIFVHPADCACRQDGGRLCDVGWLEELIQCVGVHDVFSEAIASDSASRPKKIVVTGHMVAESFGSLWTSDDQDDYFHVTKCGGV
jgi:hypothetical protein